MQNNLTVFNFNNQDVRTVTNEDGEIQFVAKDVCDVLGIKNSREAMSTLDPDEINTVSINDGIRGNPIRTVINESGLYSLTLRSRKPQAKSFKKWVTSEVLPSIRKTGVYTNTNVSESMDLTKATRQDLAQLLINSSTMLIESENERIAAETALEISKLKIREKNFSIRLLEPKAEHADRILGSSSLQTATEVAKQLEISASRLNKFLHKENVIYKVGGSWVPYAKYEDKKLCTLTTFAYTDSRGQVATRNNLKWNEKGRMFIHQLWTKKHASKNLAVCNG